MKSGLKKITNCLHYKVCKFCPKLSVTLMMICTASYIGCEVDQSSSSTTQDMKVIVNQDHTWAVEASFTTEGTVMSVWGANEEDGWTEQKVWAAGGQPEQGRMWRREDSRWVEEEIPEGPLLNWVHGTNGHLWVVGNDGRALRKIDIAAGGQNEWESFDTDTDQDLWGVFAMSPNDVWAVGGDPIGSGEVDPVLTRFDGEIWHRVLLPEPDRSGVRALFKIYGDQLTGELFAVGMKGVIYGDIGQGWEQMPILPVNDAPTNVEDFVSLWSYEDQIMAVGGRSNGVIARWNGREWRSLMLAGIPGLNGVWLDRNGYATAVGVRGAALRVAPEEYEGRRERTNIGLVLHATWGTGGEIWAVGGSLDSAPPWEGVIIHSVHE